MLLEMFPPPGYHPREEDKPKRPKSKLLGADGRPVS